MRRVAAAAFALALSACGGGESEAPKANAPSASLVTTNVAPPIASNDPAPFTQAAASTTDAGAPPGPSQPALPPPKPVTIPLASGVAGAPGDDELSAGDGAFEAGDLDGASRHYERALKAAPKAPGPKVGLARVTIARVDAPMDYGGAKGNGTIALAVSDLRKAVKLDPAFGPSYVELGRALLLLGDAEGALGSLRKGVALLPDRAEAHSALGVALLATGHGEESLRELSRAVELDSGSAARHGNLGTVLFMRGRVVDAIAEYETEVRLADGDAHAHSDLGTAVLAHNEVQRAEAELRRAIALDATRAAFHSNLGYTLQIEGKLSDAIAEYRAALQLDPKSASAWINLATALAKDPKTRGDARDALERARAIDPSDPRVKANLDELDALEHGTTAP